MTGVPGVLISTAGIAPPYIDEPYTPSSSVSPTSGSSAKVAGSRIAIATAAPTPGIAPISTPPTEPNSSAASTGHCSSMARLDDSVSIGSPLYR